MQKKKEADMESNSNLRRINLYGGPGSGKCFGKGTPILMSDGSIKPVELIQPGDEVMGPDSSPRKVVETHSGEDNLYRVVPKKGDSYIVNSQHMLSLKKKKFHKKGYCLGEETCNLSVTDYLAKSNKFRHHAKGWRTEIEFNEKPLPIDPYIFGLWLGDGVSSSARWVTQDREVIDSLEIYAQEIGLSLNQQSIEVPLPQG